MGSNNTTTSFASLTASPFRSVPFVGITATELRTALWRYDLSTELPHLAGTESVLQIMLACAWRPAPRELETRIGFHPVSWRGRRPHAECDAAR